MAETKAITNLRDQINASNTPIAHLLHGLLDLIAAPVEVADTLGRTSQAIVEGATAPVAALEPAPKDE